MLWTHLRLVRALGLMQVHTEVFREVPPQLLLVGRSNVRHLCVSQHMSGAHPHDGANISPGAHVGADVHQGIEFITTKHGPNLLEHGGVGR